MAAAEAMFAERGYANVRIADITAQAGISQGAFYRYFPDRHQLTLELLRELTDEAYDFIRTPKSEHDQAASVRESTRKYFEFYEQHRAAFGVMVELAQSDEQIAELWAESRRAFYDRISRSLARGIAAGQIRSEVNPDLAAEMLGSMSEFYAFQRFVLRDTAVAAQPIDEAIRTITDIWLTGVAHRNPRTRAQG